MSGVFKLREIIFWLFGKAWIKELEYFWVYSMLNLDELFWKLPMVTSKCVLFILLSESGGISASSKSLVSAMIFEMPLRF